MHLFIHFFLDKPNDRYYIIGNKKIKQQEDNEMNFQKGYELGRLISKLRIRGMNADANKLEENQSTNGLSNEAAQIVREEARHATNNR